jgi:predicted nucleic acid-binding protein
VIVLDTNVISEMMKPVEQRAAAVVRWLVTQPGARLYTTTISIAEIRSGLELMPEGRRRAEKRGAADRLLSLFAGRILSFDLGATTHYGHAVASRRKAAREASGYDLLIAAIARANGMAVATRNVRDFADCGIDLINPWEA